MYMIRWMKMRYTDTNYTNTASLHCLNIIIICYFQACMLTLQGQCIPILWAVGLMGSSREHPAIVTEFTGTCINPQYLSTSEHFNIFKPLLAIHHLEVLHGDVWPENILVWQIGKNHQFSIIDFGCSKITKSRERLREERQEMKLLLIT